MYGITGLLSGCGPLGWWGWWRIDWDRRFSVFHDVLKRDWVETGITGMEMKVGIVGGHCGE